MVAALAVAIPGFMLANGRSRPLLAARSLWPTKRDIDLPLIVGAALFGIGWGLAGLCPGPAITDLVTGRGSVLLLFRRTDTCGGLKYPERQFPKNPGLANGAVTPFGAIRVIRTIRLIRMKLPSRWPARAASTVSQIHLIVMTAPIARGAQPR